MNSVDSPKQAPGSRNSTQFPALRQAEILSGLPPETVDGILDACELLRFETRSEVLAQGMPVSAMYLIAEGAVEITCTNEAGQSVIVHLARRGEVFGETEALSDSPAAATCTAMPGTILLRCPGPLLDTCIATPEFVRNIARIFYKRLLRGNQNKFIDQFYPVEERLRAYLHLLSADTPEIAKTQADLAGLLGCARQTLNRELGRLRDRGVIEIEKGRIRVLDRDALHDAPVLQNMTPSKAANNTPS